MRSKPDTCSECPARSHGVGFVQPPECKSPFLACVVGQGPDEEDMNAHRAFYPESNVGRTLNKWLNQGGILRSSLLVTHIVWCWLPKSYRQGGPYGVREPTLAEMNYCYKQHVGPLLKKHDLPLIITVGDPVSEFFLDRTKVSRYRGTFNEKALP